MQVNPPDTRPDPLAWRSRALADAKGRATSRAGLDLGVVADLAIPCPTLRQLHMLAAVQRVLVAHAAGGPPPTYRELALALGVRSLRTVYEHVYSLRRRRLVEADIEPGSPAASGTLRVTPAGHRILAAWTPPDGPPPRVV